MLDSKLSSKISSLQGRIGELQQHISGAEPQAEVLAEGLEDLSIGVKELANTLEEMTERQQVEDTLRKALQEARHREAEISELLEGSRAVLRHREFEVAARSIFDSCKRLTGATAGYVALLSEDGAENDILFLDSGGAPCTVDPTLPMPTRGLREKAYLTGKTVYENDFAQSEWTKFLPEGHAGLDNVLFAPLLVKGIAVGLLGLANKPGGFNENDARLASAFGELAAIALFNSRVLESLESSEERFRSVAQNASEAIITVDSNGNIVFWNKAATTIFGYTHDEVVGKPLTFIIPERFRTAHLNGIERVVSTEESKILGKTVEMAGLRRDGSEFPVEVSLSTWRTSEGVFFTGIIHDITRRKQAEEEIRSLARFPNENHNPVLRVSQDGTILYANEASAPLLAVWACQVGQKLPDTWRQLTADAISSGAGRTVEVTSEERIFSVDLAPVEEAGYVNLYGRDITEQVQAESQRDATLEALRERTHDLGERVKELNCLYGISALVEKPDISLAEILQGTVDLMPPSWQYPEITGARVILEGQEFRTENHRETATWQQAADIIVNGQRSGTVEVCYLEERSESDEGPFLIEERSLMNAIAERLGETVERVRAEETLQRERDFISAVLDTAGALVVVLDPQGRIVRFNRACEGMTGYAYEEVEGRYLWDLFLIPEETEPVKAVFEELRAGHFPNEYENYWVAKDGSRRLIAWSNTALLDAVGGVEFIIGTGIDITERVQAEAELRKSEEKWRSITEYSPDHVTLLDRDAKILFINHTVPGLAREKVIGTSFLDYALEEYRPVTEKCFQGVLKTGKPDKFESVYRYKDGSPGYFESHVGPVRHGDKIVGLTVSSRNITERVQAEEALRQSEKKYRQLIELAQEGVWAIDTDAKTTFVNPRMAEMLGYTVDEMQGKHLFSFMDERGVEISERNLERRRQGIKEQHDFEFLRKDGTRVYTSMETSPITDENENYAGALALVADITERRQAEALLREQNEFITTVFESLGHPFYVIDANDFTIKMANTATYVGKLPETVTCYALTHRRTTPCGDSGNICPMEEIKKTGKPAVVEHIHYDQEGHRKVFEVRGHPILDNEGKVTQIIEYTLDVTNRKQAEEALRQRTNELSTLLEISRHVALTLELEPLLGTVLDHLKAVVDYDGATISSLEGGALTALAYRGSIPQEDVSQIRFSVENTFIGRQLILDQKPVIIPDVRGDSPLARDFREVVGERFPTVFGEVSSWMGVPLTIKDRVMGILALQHNEPNHYRPRQADLVLAFANQAAVAIENARLYEQAQVLAALEERQRLARDLHDAVSQTLFSASLSAEVLPQLWERNRIEGRRCLEEIHHLTRSALAEMRTLLLELRPEALVETGLSELLRQLTEAIGRRARLPVSVTVEQLCPVPPEVQVALYRISQEALNNVAKHAEASRAEVYLRSVAKGEQKRDLELRISDDGGGFDVERVAPDSLGLGIMRERAEAVGAELRIESQIGQGTQVVVVWPEEP